MIQIGDARNGDAAVAANGLDDATAAAKAFFALADPTRVAVIELLSGGERCVCELVDALGAAQPRLSFHLRTLREAGVVRATRRGRWIYYALEEELMETMAHRVGEWVERSRSAAGPSCGCGGAEGCCG